MRADKSIPELFSDLIDNLSRMFRQEVQLASREMTGSVQQASGAIGYLAAGALIGMSGLTILLGAAVAWLAWMGLEPRWGALLVGAVAAVVAAALAMKGIRDIKTTNVAPRRVMEQLQSDARVAKEQMQ
jgi:hypothetical protein